MERTMPISHAVARVNRRLTNRITRRFAGRIPPFAIVIHRGRKSGTTYRTPVMIFPTPDGFAVALTYGPDTDWVRNVVAAGGCTVEYRRRTIPLAAPRLVCTGDDGRPSLPAPVRLALRLLRVDDYLLLSRRPEP
jgi:deazaflavin-dependent oxidoreductase (nitroreductase family)